MAIAGSSTHRIFAFWTGDNPMTPARIAGFESFAITGLEPVLVTPDTLGRWIVADHPLHPAYRHLSVVHRADYLRAYCMHHHGGGYADIKRQTASWLPAVTRVLASRRLIGAGYREVRGGVPALHGKPIDGTARVIDIAVVERTACAASLALRAARPMAIGACAFYLRPGSGYTRRWFAEVEHRLDRLLPALAANPAQTHRAQASDGGGYPVPWSYLLGDITSPLSILYARRMRRDLPRPLFTDYL